jgi:arylsulfatase A-like enzyme
MLKMETIIRKYKFVISFVCITVIVGFCLISPSNFKKPNIILIVVDSLRPDHLGCYGYYRNTSPNIDSFGKEAIIFKNALAPSCYTTASVASFITSSYPSEHKVFETTPEICEGIYMNPSKPTLFELLKKNGYATGLITDMPALFLISGITSGLDTLITAGFNDPEITTEATINWIKKNNNKKFFIFLHYFGPHFPYHPSLAVNLKENLKNSDVFLPLQDYDDGFGIIPKKSMDDHILTLNHYIDNYDGKILYTDIQIGNFLQNIKKLKLENNTMIIITADHGEGFGEHYLYCGHGYILYDEIIKVPLIIKFPEKWLNNKIISRQVALLDLMPTILDYLNIKRIDCRGISLMPLIKGNLNIKSRIIYSEEPKINACITNGKYKLIYNMQMHPSRRKYLPSSEFELYNLVEDPQEHNNLFGKDVIIFGSLQKHLLNILTSLKVFETLNQQPPLHIKPEDVEKLKSLGYLH